MPPGEQPRELSGGSPHARKRRAASGATIVREDFDDVLASGSVIAGQDADPMAPCAFLGNIRGGRNACVSGEPDELRKSLSRLGGIAIALGLGRRRRGGCLSVQKDLAVRQLERPAREPVFQARDLPVLRDDGILQGLVLLLASTHVVDGLSVGLAEFVDHVGSPR